MGRKQVSQGEQLLCDIIPSAAYRIASLFHMNRLVVGIIYVFLSLPPHSDLGDSISVLCL